MDIGVAVEVSQDRTLSSLTVQHLYEMNMAAIAPPGMKLPMARGHVDLARLGNTPLIMNELLVGYGCLVNSLLNDLAVRPSICEIVDNVETIKMMVRAGLGTAIVQSTATVQTLDTPCPSRASQASRLWTL
jgi:DNA-binding transcriptional LysR family regulator